MKGIVILLLSLIGCCMGLQPKMEYHYRYSANVVTGITDKKNQFSAAAFYADVTVQVTEENHWLFELTNIEVGDFHDDHCDKDHIPFEYHPIAADGAEYLTKPFKVLINTPMEDEVLLAPDDDPIWVVNIRKSIVNIFRIYPFEDSTVDENKVKVNFMVKKQSLAGNCENWYNVQKFSDVQTQEANAAQENIIENDVQREGMSHQSGSIKSGGGAKGHKGRGRKGVSKTSKSSSKGTKTSKSQRQTLPDAATISDTLWRFTYEEDYDHCDRIVDLRHHLNAQTRDYLDRSNVGTYMLRGGPQGWRIETAHIEGSLTLSIQKDHNDHYDTFTDQKLFLVGVRSLQDELEVNQNYKTYNVWYYEILDNPKVDHTIPLERKVTGREITADEISIAKNYILSALRTLGSKVDLTSSGSGPGMSRAVHPSRTPHLAGHFDDIVEPLKILDQTQIQEFYDHEFADLQKSADEEARVRSTVFKQALIAAGTDHTILFLIEELKKDIRNDENQPILSELFTYSQNTVTNIHVIKTLKDLVYDDINWSYPKSDFVMVPGLSAVSILLNKACIDIHRDDFNRDNGCDRDFAECNTLVDETIVELSRRLREEVAEVEHYIQRMAYIQALTSLGTPKTLSVLNPIIYGSDLYMKEQDQEVIIQTRKHAMWGLLKPYMPIAGVDTVMDILMPIFENHAEHHEIRSVAFITMASWVNNYSWWSLMAKLTWTDPSNRVANFVSTTIKASAHLKEGKVSELAKRVEHLAKPAAPSSVSSSSMNYLQELLDIEQFGQPVVLGWLASSHSLLPSELMVRLHITNFLSFHHGVDGFVQQNHLQVIIYNLVIGVFSDDMNKHDNSAVEIVHEMFDKLKEDLGLENEHPERSYPYIKPRLLASVNRFIKLILSFDSTLDILLKMIVNRPHYSRHVDAYIAVPTTLGLPFIAKHTYQYAWWLKAKVMPGAVNRPVQDHHMLFKSSFQTEFEASRMLNAEVKTLIPWSQKSAVASGSKHVLKVDLPLNLGFTLHTGKKELHLSFATQLKNQIKIFFGMNYLYTLQHGSFPTGVHSAANDLRMLQHYNECPYQHTEHSNFAGLATSTDWWADIPHPFSARNLFKGDFNLLTPDFHSWLYEFTYNPGDSENKGISIVFSYAGSRKQTGNLQKQEIGGQESWGQETQGGADYDYTQFSQSSSSGLDIVEVELESDFQPTQSRQQMEKIQEQVMPIHGGFAKSISVHITLRGGTTNHEYSLITAWASGVTSGKYSTKFHISFNEYVPHGVLGHPHSTCLDINMLKPLIKPFTPVNELVEKDFRSTFEAQIHDGENCDDTPVLELKGEMSISRERLVSEEQKMRDVNCDGQESDYHPIDFITSPQYDHFNFFVDKNQDLPVSWTNLSFNAFDLFSGMAFPHVAFDHTAQTTQSILEVDAVKCHTTNTWKIHSVAESLSAIIEDVHAPYLFDVVTSPANIKETLQYDFINGRKHRACVVGEHMIKTVDGLVYPFEKTECWTTLYYSIKGPFRWSIDSRFHDGQWELRSLYVEGGLMIEMTKDSLKINGEASEGTDYLHFERTSDGSAIFTWDWVFGSYFKITDDNIFLVLDKIDSFYVAGLCGLEDGEITNEMTGPTGCAYTDPDLFVKSWTSSGEGCSGFKFIGLKKLVQAFQGACPKNEYVPTGIALPQLLDHHYETHYHMFDNQTINCYSLAPAVYETQSGHPQKFKFPAMCSELNKYHLSDKCFRKNLVYTNGEFSESS